VVQRHRLQAVTVALRDMNRPGRTRAGDVAPAPSRA
jgi:hypothetical protein